MIGKRLGEYRIIEEIGRGGMGVVYLAEHSRLKEKYALKILPQAICEFPDFVERFYIEARVMAKLRHPAIVRVVNMGKAEGVYYLVMDYVEGPEGKPKNLQDLLDERGGKLPQEKVREIILQVCGALEYAHSYRDGDVKEGIIHRDLKPLNVLLQRAGTEVAAEGRGESCLVKVSDFGLAKIVGDEFISTQIRESVSKSLEESGAARGEKSAPLKTPGALSREERYKRTSTGSIIGTYAYMSPEAKDGKPVDRRTDIYSLGVMINDMLSGMKPEGRFKLPSAIDPALWPGWDTIVDRCLQINPDDRYQCVSAVKEAVERLGRGRSRRRLWPAATVLLIVAGAVVGYLAFRETIEKGWRGWAARPKAAAKATPVPTAVPAVAVPVKKAELSAGDIVPLKRRAEAAQAKAREADAAHRAVEKYGDAETALRDADEYFGMKEWVAAGKAYEKALAGYEGAAVRADASRAKLEAEKAVRGAREAGVESYAGEQYRAGMAAMSEAAEHLRREEWVRAREAFERAGSSIGKAISDGKLAAGRFKARAEEFRRKAREAGGDKIASREFQKGAAMMEKAAGHYSREAWGLAAGAYADALDTFKKAEAYSVRWRAEQYGIRMKAAREKADKGLWEAAKAEIAAAADLTPLDAEGGKLLAAVEEALRAPAVPKGLVAVGGDYFEYQGRRYPRNVRTESAGIEMVLIEPGEFMMGSPDAERGRDKDEGPRHRVRIEKPFYLGKYEVTKEQYESLMGEKTTRLKEGNHPATGVSWTEATNYCRRVGSAFRLPTEAEWEYACRAGTTTPFSSGERIAPALANFKLVYFEDGKRKGVYRGKTVPVNSFEPNGWGLHNMHGNVWEWCEDVWHDDYQGAPTDGSAWVEDGDPGRKVLRGGSWGDGPANLRSAYRNKYFPMYSFKYVGFRIARGVD